MISDRFAAENSQARISCNFSRKTGSRPAHSLVSFVPHLATPMTDFPSRILRWFSLVLLFFPALGVCQDTLTAAKISFYGYQINQPRWRSSDFPKTITLPGGGMAKDADEFYASLGWLIPAFESDADLPPFVSGVDIHSPETLIHKSPSYAGDIDDPLESPGKNVASIPPDLKAIAYQNPGTGKEALLYHLKLQGTVPPSFLVGIAFGNLSHPLETPYGASSYRAAINDGPTTAQLPAIGNDGIIDWIFFRVDGAQAGDVVNLFGTGGANGMASLALITFDPVPQ